MAKKKEEAPPPGSPAWMATFSDLMNLLLCFFVLLFSMSSLDQNKWAQLMASMNSTFSIFNGGATSVSDGVLIDNGVSQLNELDQYINNMGQTADSENDGEKFNAYDKFDETDQEAMDRFLQQLEQQNLQVNEELSELVEEAVKENSLADQVEISFTAQYVQLSMKGALLFDSGSAELKDAAKKVLDRAVVILEKYAKGIIEIEGHTDNVPISNAKYADNEELSSARALAVFRYLVDNSFLDPVDLRHAGMGERVPIADNSTAEGRSKNRRVEIRIYNSSY